MTKIFVEDWLVSVEAEEVAFTDLPQEARYVLSNLDEGWHLFEGEWEEFFLTRELG